MVAFALLALLPVGEGRADGAVYWTGYSSLGRANLDGSLPLWPLPNGSSPALDPGSPCGLAVDDQHLYWGDTSGGAVGRAAIDGTAPNRAFITGLGAPCGVAATASYIYWSDFDTNMIGRANLDGGGPEPGFVRGGSRPCGIAVDGSHIYWANQVAGSIGRSNLDGGEVEQGFITAPDSPCGVAVAGGFIFWGDQGLGSIGRANLDGSAVLPVLVPGAGEPWGVAANSTYVYWADRWGTPANPNGGLGRAGLDGAGAIYDLVPDLRNLTGVALDSKVLSTPSAPRPSDFLHFGNLTHQRNGSVRLIVYVPARGEFTVDGPEIGWSIDKGNPPPYVGGTFRWKLRLWPGTGTKAAKRIHRQLRRKGRAPVLLRVTYQQEGRAPLEGTKRFAFQR